jgi:SAM-dependent methyltransferase
MKLGLRDRLKAIPGAVPLVRFVRSWIIPQQRALRQIRARMPGQLLQPSMVTEPDRYPEFFAFVAEQLEDCAAPRILSFGCSTGDEVFALREYMPSAELVGMDINPRAIAACQRQLAERAPDPGISFICAGNTHGQTEASFDAIFCMAVLRHGLLQASQPDSCAAILPFAQAENTVSDLARCLKPGGYLVIWNCHFRFADMAGAADFELVHSSPHGRWANQPLYGRDDLRLPSELYCEAIFRKRAG